MIVLPLLGTAGIVLHFAATLMPMPRFEGAYSTALAPQGFANYTRYMSVPPEAYEFYKQFAVFPHPDWLTASLFPGSWKWIAVVVYCAGAGLLVLASVPKRLTVQFAISCTLLALVCPAAFVLSASARKLVATARFDRSIPVAGRPQIEQVDLYQLGSKIVADYRVTFPGEPDEKGKFRGVDCWLTAMRMAPGLKAAQHTIHVGGPNVFSGYLYGVAWEKMPAGSELRFPNAGKENPDVRGVLTPGQEYDFTLFIASDKQPLAQYPLGKKRL
jgi:hypothetical protein